MKQGSRWIVNYIGTILLLGVFAVGALLLMNVGVRVYNNVVTTNNNNFTLRTSLNYIATRIRSSDVAGSILVGDIDGEDALILSEQIGEDFYYTYLYFYNGAICEFTQKKGYEVSPEYGFQVVEVNNFTIVKGENNTILLQSENKNGDMEKMVISPRTEVDNHE